MTLQDILNRIGTTGQARFRKLAKRAFNLGWTEHSNSLIAAKLVQHANTLPTGRTKTRMKAMALFIAAHDEMCYQDFIDYFDNVLGWYPDPDLHQEIKNCFADTMVVKLYMKFNKYDS